MYNDLALHAIVNISQHDTIKLTLAKKLTNQPMMTEAKGKKENGDVADNAAAPTTPKEHEHQTQGLIRSLYDVSLSEFLTPSLGDPYSVPRDPHLRLRRTLTPSLNVGIPKYAEAQFMLSKEETTGRRELLQFRVCFDDINGGKGRKHFTMDAYVWGASEAEAQIRVVTLHGISAGVSRTRWHKLGELYGSAAETTTSPPSKKVRFVALDWHSIDRSVDDDSNNEFLTCLPKHIMDVSSCKRDREEIIQLFSSNERQEWCRKLCDAISSGICPRSFDDGGRIFRAIIEEGLGWGTKDTPFILGLKSWSGGLGMRMLAQIHRNSGTDGVSFANNIQGAIIMHPGCFDKQDIVDAMSTGMIPTALMCWAKDDPLVPSVVSKMYLDAACSSGNDSKVKLVTYENGGHHNFDGSDGLPNFDIEVRDWINNLS